jgi:hypothetical protein
MGCSRWDIADGLQYFPVVEPVNPLKGGEQRRSCRPQRFLDGLGVPIDDQQKGAGRSAISLTGSDRLIVTTSTVELPPSMA